LGDSSDTERVGVEVPIAFGDRGEIMAYGPEMPSAIRVTFFVERP
jgi:hypothetical protein